MTVLVFGSTGQMGRELIRLGGAAVQALGRDRAEFTDPAACVAALTACHEATPDLQAVILAAAYTAVDRAETEEAAATAINATTPGALARAAAARGLPLVYVSTDYVFDGAGDRPFAPDDPVGPLGAYGRSKLAGETAVRAAGGVHAILRTSWVVSAHGSNFVKTMLRLGREKDRLRVVADQIGGPTPAADLARAALAAAQGLSQDPARAGTYHVAGGPEISWAGFAREIFAQAGIDCPVEDIPRTAYPTPARRPANSRLDTSGFQAAFGLPRPDWRAGLREILTERGEG